MKARITWNESKRERNLAKHGLDFADAHWVLESPYRLDVPVARAGEARIQSFVYVFEVLAVLSIAHVARDEQIRIISFRKASAQEREVYHEWLSTEAE